jgi:hypothetical protein
MVSDKKMFQLALVVFTIGLLSVAVVASAVFFRGEGGISGPKNVDIVLTAMVSKKLPFQGWTVSVPEVTIKRGRSFSILALIPGFRTGEITARFLVKDQACQVGLGRFSTLGESKKVTCVVKNVPEGSWDDVRVLVIEEGTIILDRTFQGVIVWG